MVFIGMAWLKKIVKKIVKNIIIFIFNKIKKIENYLYYNYYNINH
jgi:hypothetical protein